VSGLIVFDFDNTLVHSRIDFVGIRRELLDILRRYQYPQELDDEVARLSIGEIIDAGAKHHADIHAEAWRMVLEYETAGMVAATVEDGARATLHALRDLGYQLAVMTNNARPATLAALDLFDLRTAFDLVLTRDEVPMKPDPAGILRAMETFDSPPARTVMVGDSFLDGRAAAAAGVAFIGFRPRAGILDERGVPYWAIVERLADLAPVLASPWPTISPAPTARPQATASPEPT
jgi:phosphoglycolate phosphatase